MNVSVLIIPRSVPEKEIPLFVYNTRRGTDCSLQLEVREETLKLRKYIHKINAGLAYSIPSPQNSATILLSSLANGVSYLLPFVSVFTVTHFSMTIYF
jgi:hypothetical protein